MKIRESIALIAALNIGVSTISFAENDEMSSSDFKRRAMERSQFLYYTDRNTKINNIVYTSVYKRNYDSGLRGKELFSKSFDEAQGFRMKLQSMQSCVESFSCQSTDVGKLNNLLYKTLGGASKNPALGSAANFLKDLGLGDYADRAAVYDSISTLDKLDQKVSKEKLYEVMSELAEDPEFELYINKMTETSPGSKKFTFGMSLDELEKKNPFKTDEKLNTLLGKLNDVENLTAEESAKIKQEVFDIINSKVLPKLQEQSQQREAQTEEIKKQISETIKDSRKADLLLRKLLSDKNGELQKSIKEGSEAEKALIEQYGKAAVDTMRKILAKMRSEEEMKKQKANYEKAKQDIAEAEVYATVFTELLKFENPQMAQKLSQTFSIFFKMVNMQNAFEHKSVTGMTGALLTGNYILAAIQLFSIFSAPDQKDPDQMILESIQEIGKMLESMSKNMNERFDHIDRKLATIHRLLNHEFAKINLSLDLLRIKANESLDKLDQLYEFNAASEQRVLDGIKLVSQRPVRSCLNKLFIQERTLSESELADCEEVFFDWSMTLSSHQLLNPTYDKTDSKEKIISILGRAENENSLDANVALAFANANYLNGLIGLDSQESIPNLFEWKRGVDWINSMNTKFERSSTIPQSKLFEPLQNIKKYIETLQIHGKTLLEEEIGEYKRNSKELKRALREGSILKFKSEIIDRTTKIVIKDTRIAAFNKRDISEIVLPPNEFGSEFKNCNYFNKDLTFKDAKIDFKNPLLKDTSISIPDLKNVLFSKNVNSSDRLLIATGLVELDFCYMVVGHATVDNTLPKYVNQDFDDGHYAFKFFKVVKKTPKFLKQYREIINSMSFGRNIQKNFMLSKSRFGTKGQSLRDFLQRPYISAVENVVAGAKVKDIVGSNTKETGNLESVKPKSSGGGSVITVESFPSSNASERTNVFIINEHRISEKVQLSARLAKDRILNSIVKNDYRWSSWGNLKYYTSYIPKDFNEKSGSAPAASIGEVYFQYLDKEFKKDLFNLESPNNASVLNLEENVDVYRKHLNEIQDIFLSLEVSRLKIENLSYLIFTNEIITDEYLGSFFTGKGRLFGQKQFKENISFNNFENFALVRLFDSEILEGDEEYDWLDSNIISFEEEFRNLFSKDLELPFLIKHMDLSQGDI